MNDNEQNKITIKALLQEIIDLKYQLQIRENEIMSLQADLAMANDRIKYLEGENVR